MKIYVAFFTLIFFFCASSAHAETIFSDDFQNGTTATWGASGKGDVRLTTYAGNISMRIMTGGTALATFSTLGAKKISVTLSFAALSLGSGACIAEVSADDIQLERNSSISRKGKTTASPSIRAAAMRRG